MANISPFNFVLCDSEITWTFDDSCYISAVSGEETSISFEYEDLTITLDKRQYRVIPDNELNLTDCTPSNEFDLVDCATESDYEIIQGNITVSGNNLKHNFNLCDDFDSLNPDLNADPHTFTFHPTIINDCGGEFRIIVPQFNYVYTGNDVTLIGSQDVTLPVDKGIYLQTGNDVTLSKPNVIVVDQGSYLQTGNDVALEENRKIIRLDAGSYLQTGNDTTLLKNSVVITDQGTYVQTGNDVGVFYSLSIDQNSYAQTGNDLTLSKTTVFLAEQGTYVQTGIDVALLKNSYRFIDQGEYLQTGNDVALEENRKIIRLDAGSYLQSGNDTTLLKYNILPIDQATYTRVYNDVGFIFKLSIDQAVYNRSNNTVQLYKKSKTALDQGSYLQTGLDATLLKQNVIIADQGDYIQTGLDMGLGLNLLLMRIRPRAEYIQTGNDVGVIYKLPIEQGTYNYIGNDVGIINRITITQGSYVQSGIDIEMSFNPPAEGYTGEYASFNYDDDIVDLSIPYALDGEGYTGEYAILDSLAQTINFRCSAYSGEYSDCDFANNPPDEFEPIAYTGEYAFQDGLATTMNMYPFSNYGGEYADGDLTVLIADLLTDVDGYTGEYADFLDFETNPAEEMESIAYTSEYAVLDFINTTDVFDADVKTGESVDFPALATTDAFYPEYNESGEYVYTANFEVHHGEDLEAEAYTGEYTDADSDGIKIYHQFLPQLIISSQTAYDGWGETGGLNFCTTSCCDAELTDGLNVVFEFDDNDFGVRKPWGKCGPDNITEFDVNFRANIRFDAEGYTGENTEVFIEKELLTFLPMGDDEYWLYNPTFMPKFYGELDPLGESGETAYAELQDDRQGVVFEFLDVENNTEVEIESDLSYTEASWKYPIREFTYDTDMDMIWEGKEYIRFCPGYLIPDAQNVVFDFAGSINIGCFGYFIQTGEQMDRVVLETISGLAPRAECGQYAVASLTIYLPPGPWLLRGYTGQYATCSLNPANALYPEIAYTGEYTKSTMPDRIWEGGTGEYSEAFMIVPLPSIVWVTGDECIPNIYKPIDEDGDVIEEYENYEKCVEDMMYRGQVEATCIEEYIWYPMIKPEVIGLNINSQSEEWDDKLSLATYVNLEPTAYTGESTYMQEYLVSSGESAECDFTILDGQKMDAEAYAGELGSSDIEQSFPIPLSADALSGEWAYGTEIW